VIFKIKDVQSFFSGKRIETILSEEHSSEEKFKRIESFQSLVISILFKILEKIKDKCSESRFPKMILNIHSY